ncbi:MAG: outer membrane beta-barrel protein [Candidatus Sulfotelmatobacter sp.]
MFRKLVTVPGLRVVLAGMFVTILAGTPRVCAQQAAGQPTSDQQTQNQQTTDQQAPAQPAQTQQQTNSQQSSSQEASPEESVSRRRAKPRDYKNWTFNAGGGASLTNGATKTFARSGGGIGAAGVARNYSKYFGLRADVQFDNLPLHNSALHLAQASGGNDHVYSFAADMIFNLPVTKVWGGYIVVGPSYFHRTGKLDSSAALPGSVCNPFWAWWGDCLAGSLRQDGKFLTSTVNEFGENFGGGITHKITPKFEIYAEFRYLHGSHNGITTDLRPITIGVRW